ncbi:hypothetical protein CFOL_v3_27919 [Cephalotus follicularis]|uniref:Uncharacterized protein n=1 Tax=Cephalotus follicularis TaxID=3775 RepID=A0A1Q3CWC9_CEPFO|nr:hypothetical protein CFOL_v3_27919 [Cephalotus follicularis]
MSVEVDTYDVYNAGTIHRIGWSKHNGEWVYAHKKKTVRVPDDFEEEEIQRREEEDNPPWEGEGSSQSQYGRLLEYLNAHFDALDVSVGARFDSMRGHFDGLYKNLDSKLDRVKESVDDMEEASGYDIRATRRCLKRLERQLAAKGVIDGCAKTSGDDGNKTDDEDDTS